ncbi:SGNH/GDSL hydrolase family protein [Streptomyces sp. GC420]|uniref:SGNH/GDSL hydrolase family protein n=1 Tax=Streptomyces sp. GC420 TaxID=2697568 RepID=UPI001415075C|nr:SGNH/GDSL hydrolase family protein [Streptomyces sp. GC420]NBM14991.1 SGNH/GDSL hydrolase family protein [Streptomyces sp. GC420]
MRKPWIVGVLCAAVLVAATACGDPSSGAGSWPPSGPAHAAPAASASPSSAPSSRRRAIPSAPAERPTVLYLGDSLAMENQKVLGGLLREELGAEYTGAPYSGTTLCDYLDGTGDDSLVPPEDKAAALVRRLRPDVVILQFWGNAWGYTPCMDGITHDAARQEYFDRYRADARRLTERIAAAAGAVGTDRPKIVWVLQGPDPITPDRVRRVNAVYEKQAAASGDLLADAGRAVSPAAARYSWVRYLPCTASERGRPGDCTQPGRGRTALHREDDHLHFCLAPTTSTPRPCPVRSPGILRYTRAIGDAVADHLRN